jgi:deazaflavin-dependent oxidoreductase (nitroreductase family)
MAERTRMSFLAPVTTRVFNPAMRVVAGRVPGLGVVTHRGRRTGRQYRTPVLVLRKADRLVVALWYGVDAHWVRNLLAAGGGTIRTRGRDRRLVDPVVVEDRTLRELPLAIRLAARGVGVRHLLHAVETPVEAP